MSAIKETESHFVIEFVSGSGEKYEVGYPKEAGYTKENLIKEVEKNQIQVEPETLDSDGYYKKIDWVPNGSSTTSQAAKDIGIDSGYVTKDADAFSYVFQVNFINSGGWWFKFKDASGAAPYYCSTPLNGRHYINYNSAYGEMVGVH